jgi:F-type H+-transporting ATPase subunit a
MLTILQDELRYPIGQPKLSRVLPKLKTTMALLLFTGAFMSVGGDYAHAMNARSSASPMLAKVAGQTRSDAVTSEPEDNGPSQKAVEIARPFGFPITNSMVACWIVAVGLIVFAQLATRHMMLIPEGVQNFWEWLVEWLYTFLRGIIGPHLVERTFWYFATVFIFILSVNWVGLIPGVGTVGWGRQSSHGFTIDQPWFRGGDSDLNLTLAMALVFFACWLIWALQELGPLGFLKELFAAKGDTAGLMKVVMVVIFFASGCLEIVSILFRPVALSFRLYGNIFAGENMLDTMSKMVPHLGWLLPIPFYFQELLVGLVQALVFMLLTAVFTLLNCRRDEEPAAAQG